MQLHILTPETLHKIHSFSGSFEQPHQEVLKHDERSPPQVRQILLNLCKGLLGCKNVSLSARAWWLWSSCACNLARAVSRSKSCRLAYAINL